MKRAVVVLMMVFAAISGAHAGNGDLVVDGRLGVGSPNPDQKLNVVGNIRQEAGNEHRFYNAAKNNWTSIDSPLVGGDAHPDFRIRTATGLLYMDRSGNVGIGTTTPSHTLDIAGSGGETGIHITNLLGGNPIIRFRKGVTPSNIWGMFVGSTSDNNLYLYDYTSGGYRTIFSNSGVSVSGSLSATVKYFDIKDPRYDDDRKRLVHSSLEGPEVGVYYRGEVQLANGKAEVRLPEYFEALTSKENRTVLLTPKFGKDDDVICNVASSDIINGSFAIRAFGPPDSGGCSHRVFWEVKAERSDVGKHQAERVKEDKLPVHRASDKMK